MFQPVTALSGGTAMWYLGRAAGSVTLLLLTLTVVLGITTSLRWTTARIPRFVTSFVHRNMSLLVLVFLAIHVVTVVSDSFAPIGWKDTIVPFASAYRPIWLGFGAVAFDLVLALVLTSLFRHRIGASTWRFVHWFAYACWPIAVLHGLGSGSDTKSPVILALTASCVVTVLVAISLRLANASTSAPARAAAWASVAVTPLLLAGWLVSGPLASGWARASGTPASLLGAPATLANPSSTPAASSSTTTPTASPLPPPGVEASVTGTVRQSAPDRQGLVVVRLVGSIGGRAEGTLDIELRGRPLARGGVALEAGTTTVTGARTYRGPVTGLEGDRIVAELSGPDTTRVQLAVALSELDLGTGRMTGTVTATPTRG